MVIDPSSGYNKGGVNNTSAGSSKVKAPASPSTEANSPSPTNSDDSVSLSNKAQAMARLEAAVAEAPETNETKVAAIKQAVDNGSYEINAQSIANKMLEQDQHLF